MKNLTNGIILIKKVYTRIHLGIHSKTAKKRPLIYFKSSFLQKCIRVYSIHYTILKKFVHLKNIFKIQKVYTVYTFTIKNSHYIYLNNVLGGIHSVYTVYT